jgi:hypothetical protein
MYEEGRVWVRPHEVVSSFSTTTRSFSTKEELQALKYDIYNKVRA